MDVGPDELLVLAESRLERACRRACQAEVCLDLYRGSPRKAEEPFGWARDTDFVAAGYQQFDSWANVEPQM